MKKTLAIAAIVVLAVAALYWHDHRPHPETPGTVTAQPLPAEVLAGKLAGQHAAIEKIAPGHGKQILFGDLHVHTTYSMDAFAWSLPIFHGEGVHPPAEACDYARYCSGLDFWASTEHAESLTPDHWRDIQQTVARCNAVAGDAANPDLVSFLGWEWTQMGDTAAEHYGHKNVILKDFEPGKVPARPIGAGGEAGNAMRNSRISPLQNMVAPYLDFSSRESQIAQQQKMAKLRATTICASGVPVRELPVDCVEFAEHPDQLFAKLDDWGFPALVIPHGNTWGFYTPPGGSWDKQLTAKQHKPERQKLIEVFSGHGNSEEYRDWREASYDAQGQLVCPPPSKNYLPSCWRAGEIIRSRCGTAPKAECEARVLAAQQNYLAAGRAGRVTVPGVQGSDWLDAGQCRDCYLPAFNYRPANSVQYAMALSNFEELDAKGQPLRFRFGFIASSDNHAAQPGTGYKELGRHANTEVYGQEGLIRKQFMEAAEPKTDPAHSVPYSLKNSPFNFMQITESERLQSYFYTGGLVAVHAPGRSRDAIWNAMNAREVYATSGERMLLWFDLLGPDATTAPMGSEVRVGGNPRFKVRALGDFEQKPGCPAHSVSALTPEKVEQVCRGECYNPSDVRKPIAKIEVVRIRPQATPGEPMGKLIEDPWRSFQCSDDANGCQVEFEDPLFMAENREVIYYVRALGAPSPAVNGGLERCERDDKGECLKTNACYGDDRTANQDDCLAAAAERAWSSPIFVRGM